MNAKSPYRAGDLDIEWLLSADRKLPPADELIHLAARLADAGRLDLAAIACDAAFEVAPSDADVAASRARVLNRLEIREHGLVFRYIPAGPFKMGSEDGDDDERPVHPVELDAYWISDMPVSWGAFTAALGWSAPLEAMPPGVEGLPKDGENNPKMSYLRIHISNRIRGSYCADDPVDMTDEVKRQIEEYIAQTGMNRKLVTYMFSPGTWREKPMVAVSTPLIEELMTKLTNSHLEYRLPTEAEWEKAARGGLVGRRYPWGDAPPTPETCDFNRFEEFGLRNSRAFPPNGYGLHSMSGGVHEITADGYDALYYRESPRKNPRAPAIHGQRVARGGSWADCASAVTVSFRTGLHEKFSNDPTIGFRLCRVARKR